jgi:hypothetical protein
MKKFIKSIAVAIIVLGGFNAFAQVPNGGQVTTSSCEVDCGFTSCKATCKSSSTKGGGAAICTCYLGFASCGCGGGGGTVSANGIQMINLNKLINHLEGYNSPAGISLKGKVVFLTNELSLNHTEGLSQVVSDIIVTIETLSPVEKSNLTNFVNSITN